MYFKIDFESANNSFAYEVNTKTPDIESVMIGLDSFIKSVMDISEVPETESEEEDPQAVREALYDEVDAIVDDMYGYFDE